MAIIQEHFMVGERDFIRTYSDQNVLIHGGFPEGDYEEANDPVDSNRTYTETDIPINTDAEEVLDILMGVES